MRITALLVALASLASLAGCDPTEFDTWSARAPVREIGTASGFGSASFGDAVLGLGRGRGEPGTMVTVLGNGDASMTTADIIPDGSAATTGTSRGDLGAPPRFEALAPGPIGPGPGLVPLVYVSGGDKVQLVDPIQFRWPYSDPTPALVLQADASWGPQVTGLGLSLAAAKLDADAVGDDLVAGADGALVLLRVKNLALDKARVLAGDKWAGKWGAVAVGDLGAADAGAAAAKPVVVAGVADRNVVRVVFDPAACVDLATDCPTLELAAPDGAKGFGASVLIADFDPGEGARGNELLVGAPGSGQVFVYTFTAADLAPDGKPSVATISAPLAMGSFGNAEHFGAALAFGRIGDSARLAVGAPYTAVDGVDDAGALYLYQQGSRVDPKPVALASPRESGFFGRHLGLVPFTRAPDNVTTLLAAAGSQAVYVFFADPLTGQGDVRQP